MNQAGKQEILITVKAYPNPSGSLGEAACIAGIDRSSRLVRLYPVPFRQLKSDRQFKKYQWIKLNVSPPNSDHRPETFRPDFDSIETISNVLSTKNGWEERRKVVDPCLSPSMCWLRKKQQETFKSLGVFKPVEILDFTWDKENSDWSGTGKNKVNTADLFLNTPGEPLEKIPYSFRYVYRCADCGRNHEHRMKIVDWELAQLFRKMRDSCETIEDCLKKVKYKWLEEITDKNKEVYFFAGNMMAYPNSFLILGVFWPPRVYQKGLFG